MHGQIITRTTAHTNDFQQTHCKQTQLQPPSVCKHKTFVLKPASFEVVILYVKKVCFLTPPPRPTLDSHK